MILPDSLDGQDWELTVSLSARGWLTPSSCARVWDGIDSGTTWKKVYLTSSSILCRIRPPLRECRGWGRCCLGETLSKSRCDQICSSNGFISACLCAYSSMSFLVFVSCVFFVAGHSGLPVWFWIVPTVARPLRVWIS